MDEQIHTDNTETLTGAISLLAEIRYAAGDPKGKLMQDELVRKIRIMRNSLESIAFLTKTPDETTVAQIKTIATDALNPLQ